MFWTLRTRLAGLIRRQEPEAYPNDVRVRLPPRRPLHSGPQAPDEDAETPPPAAGRAAASDRSGPTSAGLSQLGPDERQVREHMLAAMARHGWKKDCTA
jgi:hypothetical protein